ncbi:hypothetical protein FA95DRAFT_1605126 [Auriscalpium vulgare]|uniref:Uncharacterized protein n=1 Tax=Auriscalpium vulgare TaxID=40419 RepID=A0ACB8RYD7_9AGAM|nr:hypothetical protein FA95DRAFT_1605126 [Auriscalpium vulgare]
MQPHLQRAFDMEHGLLVGMLETLKANPELEHLLLVDCLPPTILSSDIVNLPRLQSIKLGGSIVACAQTMGHIAIPSSARTHFSCLYDEQDAPHAPLLRLVGERFAPSGTGKSVKISTLMVKCGGIYSPVSVIGWEAPFEASGNSVQLCDNHFGPPDVVLTLPTKNDPRQLKAMCDALHLDDSLQAVYICLACDPSIHDLWTEVFGGYRSVRFVQLETSHNLGVSFCETFVLPLEEGDASGGLFPELNTLALDLRFDSSRHYEYFSPSFMQHRPPGMFTEKLRQRAARTPTFCTLHFHYRGMYDNFLPIVTKDLSILSPAITVITGATLL